jgi:hypothetical protein
MSLGPFKIVGVTETAFKMPCLARNGDFQYCIADSSIGYAFMEP